MLVYQRVSVHYAWNTDTPAVASKRISCRRLKMGHTQIPWKKNMTFPTETQPFCIPEKKKHIPLIKCNPHMKCRAYLHGNIPLNHIKSRCSSIVNSIAGAFSQEYLLMKTADFVQEKSEEIELSLSDAIRVTGDNFLVDAGLLVCLKIRCPIHCEIIIFNINLSSWGVPHFQTHPYDGLSPVKHQRCFSSKNPLKKPAQ